VQEHHHLDKGNHVAYNEMHINGATFERPTLWGFGDMHGRGVQFEERPTPREFKEMHRNGGFERPTS